MKLVDVLMRCPDCGVVREVDAEETERELKLLLDNCPVCNPECAEKDE